MEAPAITQQARAGAATILVVEDEHLVALDIQQCLTRMHYKPVVVYSGEAAVFAVDQMSVDLVVMDIKLPGGLDGIDAASAIRRAHDIPIIYLTAYTDPVTLERARVTEPYGYVLKPFQERELMAAIEMALHRHDKEQRRAEHRRIERFLSEATAKLVSSLDAPEVARGATALLVPRYADGCVIHLREGEAMIPELTCASPWDEEAVPEELRTLIGTVENTRHVWGCIAAHSSLGVPLIARGQLFGALATTFSEARQHDDLPDRSFVEGFAQRLGVALDNARLYRRTQRALELRDDVLAIVSHDLRAPLATMLLHAELLGDHPPARSAADSIRQSAQLMSRIIGDLLDASAINAGQLTVERGEHRASEIVEEAVQLFRAEAAAREVSLRAVVSEQTANVSCDRDRIVQVLANLIGNALKFTPSGGAVTVRATREVDSIRFEVEDTGTGIPEDQVPKLFDRFWRGEARGEGAGLGLFIARGIVAAHGGKIDVVTAIGTGSRFHFALPAAN